jgi:hypothetical protein
MSDTEFGSRNVYEILFETEEMLAHFIPIGVVHLKVIECNAGR